MRGHHEESSLHRAPAAPHLDWVITGDFVHLGVFEDEAAISRDAVDERGEVLRGMESRLSVVAHGGRPNNGASSTAVASKPSWFATSASRPHAVSCLVEVLDGRRVQIAGHPGEVTVDPFSQHDVVHLRDGSKPGIPGRPRVVFAESADEIAEQMVGHGGQMRRRVTGLTLGDPPALDQGHGRARLLQQIGGRQPRDPAADDHGVDLEVPVERRIVVRTGRRQPQWGRVEETCMHTGSTSEAARGTRSRRTGRGCNAGAIALH